MSLTSALNASTSGLRNTQYQLDLVSRNIANASTEGYTRKTSEQAAQILDGEAKGVLSNIPQRRIDFALQRQLRETISSSSSYDVQVSYLTRLELTLGRPEDEDSLAHRLGDIQEAFVSLTAQPNSQALQRAALVAAEDYARVSNDLAETVRTLRDDANTQIGNVINQVNSLLHQVDSLNVQIIEQKAQQGPTADLEDTRDMLMNQLSEILPVKHYVRENGDMAISTASGRALLDGQVFELSFAPQTITHSSKYPVDIDGIMLNGEDITTVLNTGELGGLIELRDNILPQMQAQMDELNGTVISSFAAAGLELFTDPLNAPFTMPGDEVGISARIQVNSVFDTDLWRLRDGTVIAAEGPPSDSSLITSVIDAVFNTSQSFRTTGLGPGGGLADINSGLSSSTTLDNYASSIITFQAIQKASLDDTLDLQSNIKATLDGRMKDQSGVNIDEELARLITLENGYSASARVITTLQRLFEELSQTVR